MAEGWNDEQIKTLRELFAANASDAEIAAAVGKSKNAVIGERNRRGLLRDRRQPPRPAPLPAPRPALSVPPPNGVGLIGLRWWMCQSVREIVGPDNFPVYCGKRKTVVVVDDRRKLSSYCRVHHDQYHQPNQQRQHHGEVSEVDDN